MKCPDCFSAFRSTVAACSCPKEGTPLIDSAEVVIDFDAVKDRYAQRLCASRLPCSADSLFLTDAGDPVFAEFKSGSCQAKEIAQKIYDSALIYSELMDVSVGWLRKHAAFVLVHPGAGTLSADRSAAGRQRLSAAGLKRSSLPVRLSIPPHVAGFFLKSAEELTPAEFTARFLKV